MSSSENPWLSSSGLAAILNPSSSTPGGPPPTPPDPPDPPSPAFLAEFPPLSPSLTNSTSTVTVPATVKPQSTTDFTTLPCKEQPANHISFSEVPDVIMEDNVVSADSETRSGSIKTTVVNPADPAFTILPPKHSSPIITNRASDKLPLLPNPSPNSFQTSSPVPPISPSNPPPFVTNSPPEPAITKTTQKPAPKSTPRTKSPHSQTQTYAAKVRIPSDKSLKRLAPTTISPEGKPRVLIPDAVFERGAALHKQYVVGSFLGKMPDYGPIQSVLNFMWGKGSKLEIHLQPLKHSMLVRVPNDYIRSKILEKKLWYVDTSMFYVSQWGSHASESYPEIESIPLWAHLRGIPFDLRTKEGLSHAAALVGEPIETDDYTKNVTSLNVAHVKVEANLTKALPSAGELVRENGDVINVEIDYPWIPPSCTHCNRIGHILKNCIYPPSQPSTDTQPPPQDGPSPESQPGLQTAPPLTPQVHLNGYSPHTNLPLPVDPPPTISAESDSQAAVDFITDSMTLDPPTETSDSPENTTTPPLGPPTVFQFTASPSLPPLLSQSLPTSPLKNSLKSPPPISFSSSAHNASVVVCLPTMRAPYSNSYIAKKQASLFNSPQITLPASFYDQTSASWQTSTLNLKPPIIPPPPCLPTSNSFLALSTDPEEAIPDGNPPPPSL
ncbi:proline-rich protein 36-like [Brassica napus]|uniref:proline-rich protein 36-like n=1 Tax=Brassica napus TaxID=3708 RepID=UPI002078673B|nr:proline-rich protein 36-like [Brassica napus]